MEERLRKNRVAKARSGGIPWTHRLFFFSRAIIYKRCEGEDRREANNRAKKGGAVDG